MTNQFSLFAENSAEQLLACDGELCLHPDWLAPAEADQIFRQLREELAWEQSIIRIQGQERPIPRLNAWYGDPGCRYAYSGVGFEPLAWTETLAQLRVRLQASLGISVNSVLANLYRDGRDSVAWHSDNEPELGSNPIIASVSLGAERRFSVKHKTRKDLPTLTLDLPHGSLLVMSGTSQHYWVHQLTKTSRPVGERVNLTFRYIYQ